MKVEIKRQSSSEQNVSARHITYDLYVDGKYQATYDDIIKAMAAKDNLEKGIQNALPAGYEITRLGPGSYKVNKDGVTIAHEGDQAKAERFVKDHAAGKIQNANMPAFQQEISLRLGSKIYDYCGIGSNSVSIKASTPGNVRQLIEAAAKAHGVKVNNWVPLVCSFCGQHGHRMGQCPKRGVAPRKVAVTANAGGGYKVVEQGSGSNVGYLVTDGKSNKGLYDKKVDAQKKADDLNQGFQNGRTKAAGQLLFQNIHDEAPNVDSMSNREQKTYLKVLRSGQSAWNPSLKKLISAGKVNPQAEIKKLEQKLGLKPGEEVY